MAVSNYQGQHVCGRMPHRMLQHLGNCSDCATFTPEDDGPVVLMIGAHAAEDKLRNLARRHGLRLEDLLTFQKQ